MACNPEEEANAVNTASAPISPRISDLRGSSGIGKQIGSSEGFNLVGDTS